eukprot:s4764_g4.t1
MMLCSRNLALIIKMLRLRDWLLQNLFTQTKSQVEQSRSCRKICIITVPLTEPCRPSMDSAEARLITVCRSNSHREVQKAGLFLVELAEARQMHFAVPACQYDASSCYGGPGSGPELGRLHRGDIVAAQACDAASPCEEWLRLLFDNPVRRLVVLESAWHSEESSSSLSHMFLGDSFGAAGRRMCLLLTLKITVAGHVALLRLSTCEGR